MSRASLDAAARRWFYQTRPDTSPGQLSLTLARCADHLVAFHGAKPLEAARDAANRAWGEVEAGRSTAWFDIDASSPHLVFIEDPVSRTRRALSLSDALRLLGPRPVAAA